MKKLKLWSILMFILMAMPLMVACGGGDDDEKGGNGGGTNQSSSSTIKMPLVLSL